MVPWLILIWIASEVLLCQYPLTHLFTPAPSQPMAFWNSWAWTAMPFLGSPLFTACLCTFLPSCHNLLYLKPSNSPRFSFVTDEDLRGRNVLHIDSIATCSLKTDHLFTLHRSMSLYQIMITSGWFASLYPHIQWDAGGQKYGNVRLNLGDCVTTTVAIKYTVQIQNCHWNFPQRTSIAASLTCVQFTLHPGASSCSVLILQPPLIFRSCRHLQNVQIMLICERKNHLCPTWCCMIHSQWPCSDTKHMHTPAQIHMQTDTHIQVHAC